MTAMTAMTAPPAAGSSAAAPVLVTVGECLGLITAAGLGGMDYATRGAIGFGGAEGNVAICATRLGARVTWIGRVGDDALGRRITRTLRGEGVDVRAILDSEKPTALMLKDRPYAGRSRVSYYRAGAAGSRIEPADLPLDAVRSATVLHVTGITLALSESARATVFAAVRAAREAGAIISFDVNHRGKLWSAEDAAPVYRELAGLADVIFAGDDEAAILVGDGAPEEIAERLRALGPGQAVIKLGERGAVAVVGDGVSYEQSAFVVPVADTVGAGDAFVAGYLVELMGGESPQQSLRTAAACGACACRGEGDWESMPARADLVDLSAGGDPVER